MARSDTGILPRGLLFATLVSSDLMVALSGSCGIQQVHALEQHGFLTLVVLFARGLVFNAEHTDLMHVCFMTDILEYPTAVVTEPVTSTLSTMSSHIISIILRMISLLSSKE